MLALHVEGGNRAGNIKACFHTQLGTHALTQIDRRVAQVKQLAATSVISPKEQHEPMSYLPKAHETLVAEAAVSCAAWLRSLARPASQQGSPWIKFMIIRRKTVLGLSGSRPTAISLLRGRQACP